MAAFELALTKPTPVIIGLAGWLVTDESLPYADPRRRDRGLAPGRTGHPARRTGSGRGRRPEAVSEDWMTRAAAERAPMFEDVADLVIDVDRLEPNQVVQRILAAVPAADVPG